MIHYLTLGHLDPEALLSCAAVATTPLDETTVRSVLAEFPGIVAERKDGYVILPWHGLGSVDVSEAFALRMHERTGCMIADRRNGRLISPEALSRKKPVEVQELTRARRSDLTSQTVKTRLARLIRERSCSGQSAITQSRCTRTSTVACQ